MVHVDCSIIVNGDTENVPGQKGILCRGLTDKDTSDQYAGCIWIIEKYAKGLQQKNWTSSFTSIKIRTIRGGS